MILSNSKSQAVIKLKIDELSARVDKHNSMIERTYHLVTPIGVTLQRCFPIFI